MAKIEVLDAIVTSCWLGNNPQRFPCLAFSVCGQGSKVLSVNDAAKGGRVSDPGPGIIRNPQTERPRSGPKR